MTTKSEITEIEFDQSTVSYATRYRGLIAALSRLKPGRALVYPTDLPANWSEAKAALERDKIRRKLYAVIRRYEDRGELDPYHRILKTPQNDLAIVRVEDE